MNPDQWRWHERRRCAEPQRGKWPPMSSWRLLHYFRSTIHATTITSENQQSQAGHQPTVIRSKSRSCSFHQHFRCRRLVVSQRQQRLFVFTRRKEPGKQVGRKLRAKLRRRREMWHSLPFLLSTKRRSSEEPFDKNSIYVPSSLKYRKHCMQYSRVQNCMHYRKNVTIEGITTGD